MAQLTIITLKQLRKRIPYSRQHIARLERAGKFPRRTKLTPNGLSVWNEAEITAWLEQRFAERNADTPPADDKAA